MFHSLPCPCARLGGTLLSRFRARALPCLFCKTGFAASMPQGAFPGGRRRLCAVKVKLTMRLGVGAGAASVSALELSPVFSARVPQKWMPVLRSEQTQVMDREHFLSANRKSTLPENALGPTRLLHRRCQTGLVVARGGVGMSPGFLVREDQHGRGRASQASLFLWRLASCGDPDLALQRQAA